MIEWKFCMMNQLAFVDYILSDLQKNWRDSKKPAREQCTVKKENTQLEPSTEDVHTLTKFCLRILS